MTTERGKENVYDSVYHTLIEHCGQLIIPVVNEIFGTSYTEKDKPILLQNDQYVQLPSGIRKQITDSYFGIVGIADKRYHIECQSTPDGNMLLRMFEYDVQDAAMFSEQEGTMLTVTFPYSAVMFLRKTRKTPELMKIRLIIPDGQVVTYAVKCLKVQEYSIEEILEKNLWFLIPFYLFRYEKDLLELEEDEGKRLAFRQEYRMIREQMRATALLGEIDEATERILAEMVKEVADALAERYTKVREEVRQTMVGEVIQTPTVKLVTKAKAEGRAEGLSEGLAEGKAEGLAEGKAEGLAEGKAEGLAEGKAEGLAEGKAEQLRAIAEAMQADGKTVAEIARLIHVTEEEIAAALGREKA